MSKTLLATIITVFCIISNINAINLPEGFEDNLVLENLRDPASMAFSPDGRLFYGERITGKLRVAKYNSSSEAWEEELDPFYTFDVPAVRHRSSGLRGFCFDPNFSTNGYIYAYYMKDNPRHNRVVRIQADPNNPDLALTNSETLLMEVPFNGTTSSGSHNGGDLIVGDDDMLYFTTGDGWNGGDNVQSLTTYTGKIFRINTNGTVPTDNPFYAETTGNYRAIYALGVRNPYTIAKNSNTGDIFINEARGTNKADIFRINADGSGARSNFGHDGNSGIGSLKGPWKNATEAGGKLITGGTWYPNDGYWPEQYRGNYFPALWGGNGSDTDGKIISISSDQNDASVSIFANNVFASPGRHKPVMTKVGLDGNLYYMLTDYETGTGQIRMIKYTGEVATSSPAFTPQSGQYDDPQTITITSATQSSSIYYTIDGSIPTTNSNLYTTPISISETKVLRAVAIAAGFVPSSQTQGEYSIGPVANIPPVANAGPDLLELLGSRVTLNGAASYDPDGSQLEIVEDWIQVSGPSVTIEDADETVANFTPTTLGTYVFRIIITDVDGAVDIDEATITVVSEIEDVLDGLVARWTMEDGQGGVIQDFSANSYNGAIQGPLFMSETPDFSNFALSFDGTDDLVDVGTLDLSSSAMSVVFWFKADDFGVADARFISKAKGQFDDDHLWMVSTLDGTKLRFRLRTEDITTTLVTDSGVLATDVWSHVAAVYDGSTMIIYVNGEEIIRTAKTGQINSDPTMSVAIGNQPANASGGARPFDGLIDEMRIYGRALSQTDIATIMQSSNLAVSTLRGNLQSHIDSLIQAMPGDSGDDYIDPSVSEILDWEAVIALMLDGNNRKANIKARSIQYEVITFLDTTIAELQEFAILQKTELGDNHWGTFVYNNKACRNLVIQCPHPRFDTNTGSEGAYLFSRLNTSALMISGTHRCNSSISSSCSGTTEACGATSAYKVSDQAHNETSTFQSVTNQLSNFDSSSVFIQLHGFNSIAGDPNLILSNGTRVTPAFDPILDIKSAINASDPSISFKVAHQDLSWTRLLGFANTQGRLVNESTDACNMPANSSLGRFIHMEQDLATIRVDETGWSIVLKGIADVIEIPENNTWIGSSVGNWLGSNSNWSSGRIPSPCDHIIIPAGITVTLDEGESSTVRSVTVEDSGNLNVKPSAILKIKE